MWISIRAWDFAHGFMELGKDDIDQPTEEECEIMQYTGLKASDEVTDVYEGDIINATGVIVGNKYESPQILEEGDNCVIEGMGTRAWRGTESIAMGRGCIYAE